MSSMQDILDKKRNGDAFRADEVEFFVKEVTNETIQKEQLGAMLMAMINKGLNEEETTWLTEFMMKSGVILDWPEEWKGKIVDKHSTGGVGDKISLVLAPALAACGMKVPMISGRGLEHTGGTLDKLEAIPGFCVSQTHAEMKTILEEVGCCIVGQTDDLVPADKHMYAARDVTRTVNCLGLITSSIISKKAAEKLDALVLDVKVGKGAFMKTEADARELAKSMVAAGEGLGIQTVALLTSMDSPLGRMVGNALEVAECIACLQNEGPEDVKDLTVELGGHLLYRSGNANNLEEGFGMIRKTLEDGTAMKRFHAMLKAQGVKEEDADRLCKKGSDVMEVLKRAERKTSVKCDQSGFVHDIDAMKCGIVSFKLGAGRDRAGDPVNHVVGLELHTAVGERIECGTVWVDIHHDDKPVSEELLDILKRAITVKSRTRVIDVVEGDVV